MFNRSIGNISIHCVHIRFARLFMERINKGIESLIIIVREKMRVKYVGSLNVKQDEGISFTLF